MVQKSGSNLPVEQRCSSILMHLSSSLKGWRWREPMAQGSSSKSSYKLSWPTSNHLLFHECTEKACPQIGILLQNWKTPAQERGIPYSLHKRGIPFLTVLYHHKNRDEFCFAILLDPTSIPQKGVQETAAGAHGALLVREVQIWSTGHGSDWRQTFPAHNGGFLGNLFILEGKTNLQKILLKISGNCWVMFLGGEGREGRIIW